MKTTQRNLVQLQNQRVRPCFQNIQIDGIQNTFQQNEPDAEQMQDLFRQIIESAGQALYQIPYTLVSSWKNQPQNFKFYLQMAIFYLQYHHATEEIVSDAFRLASVIIQAYIDDGFEMEYVLQSIVVLSHLSHLDHYYASLCTLVDLAGLFQKLFININLDKILYGRAIDALIVILIQLVGNINIFDFKQLPALLFMLSLNHKTLRKVLFKGNSRQYPVLELHLSHLILKLSNEFFLPVFSDQILKVVLEMIKKGLENSGLFQYLLRFVDLYEEYAEDVVDQLLSFLEGGKEHCVYNIMSYIEEAGMNSEQEVLFEQYCQKYFQ
ncbi:Hypothetical_protein [Hexamita inflata]|uniref:Hypothetical_protein n=1 Tax=Hexamita inflata TaxID=28002 RepID=A0AA86NIH6_9EUKA|nr:Hypothetical protein HINF_LOCUS8244 [Hexamita inflata]